MPQLDVSDILTDIDFFEGGLICNRMSQVIGENGMAVNRAVPIPFGGVVTSISYSQLRRTPEGEVITGSILICTRFRLMDGKSGFTADIVQRGDRSYTVADVNNYSRYGRGFVEATCELLPLAGSTKPPPGYPGSC
jgi:galactose-6-phosphate isomerase